MDWIISLLRDNRFRASTLTEVMNRTPFVPNYLQSLGLTTASTHNIATTTATVYKTEQNGVKLLSVLERGQPLPNRSRSKREMQVFPLGKLGEEATFYFEELQDVVGSADGMDRELAVASKVNDLLVQNENDLNATEENHLLGAVQGIVVDADGTTEVYNWFDEFGISPATEINLNLASATLESLQKQFRAMKRSMARAAQGVTWNGETTALCGDTIFDELVSHPEVNKTYLNQVEAQTLRGEVSPFATVRMFGIDFVNYRGTDDNSTIKIPDAKMKIFPRAPGVFSEYRGPGEGKNNVNKPGKRRFVQAIEDNGNGDNPRFVTYRTETYPMFMCKYPEMLRSAKQA